jgi:hypothetical protein
MSHYCVAVWYGLGSRVDMNSIAGGLPFFLICHKSRRAEEVNGLTRPGILETCTYGRCCSGCC